MSQYLKSFKESEKKIIAIDFDGVIHNDNLGYHDGSIYGQPIQGSLESLKAIKEQGFEIIIYSCKCHPDRPLINNKTGKELVWEWLEKKGFKEFIKDVVWGKPHAFLYIDDKAIEFNNNWKDILKRVL